MFVERRNFEEIFTKDGNEASSNSNRKKKEIFLFMKSWALRVSFEGNEVSTGGYKYVYFFCLKKFKLAERRAYNPEQFRYFLSIHFLPFRD